VRKLECFKQAVAAVSRTALMANSFSVPFLEQPAALDGTMAGDVGFDPIGFTGMWSDKDWSQQIVPDIWPEAGERTPVTTLEWMREAELKHSRFAMLAVLGWVAVDCGLRFPGAMFESIPNSIAAHNAAVDNGSMGFLLSVVGVCELATGAAIFDQAKGSGRAPGDFSFDPLKLAQNEASLKRYQSNEIKNGRLAMIAFSGIVTQAAVFSDKGFPYF
jgi:hypothetical protein